MRGIDFAIPSASSGDDPTAEDTRLPKPGEKCPLTGLSRTSLVEVIDERDPQSGEFLVLQDTKKRHGKQQGIRMIHRTSLLAHFEKRAREQSRRRFAEGVNNPEGYSAEGVISDFELWCDFTDELGEATERSWKKLSRAERIGVLDRLGLLAPAGAWVLRCRSAMLKALAPSLGSKSVCSKKQVEGIPQRLHGLRGGAADLGAEADEASELVPEDAVHVGGRDANPHGVAAGGLGDDDPVGQAGRDGLGGRRVGGRGKEEQPRVVVHRLAPVSPDLRDLADFGDLERPDDGAGGGRDNLAQQRALGQRAGYGRSELAGADGQVELVAARRGA